MLERRGLSGAYEVTNKKSPSDAINEGVAKVPEHRLPEQLSHVGQLDPNAQIAANLAATKEARERALMEKTVREFERFRNSTPDKATKFAILGQQADMAMAGELYMGPFPESVQGRYLLEPWQVLLRGLIDERRAAAKAQKRDLPRSG